MCTLSHILHAVGKDQEASAYRGQALVRGCAGLGCRHRGGFPGRKEGLTSGRSRVEHGLWGGVNTIPASLTDTFLQEAKLSTAQGSKLHVLGVFLSQVGGWASAAEGVGRCWKLCGL